jgi:hypothetical protein
MHYLITISLPKVSLLHLGCLDLFQTIESLVVAQHIFDGVFWHPMGVLFSALSRIEGPWTLCFFNTYDISIFLSGNHVLFHLPKPDIGIIDDDKWLTLKHGLHCPLQIFSMVVADHLGIVFVLAVHHEEVIGRVYQALFTR